MGTNNGNKSHKHKPPVWAMRIFEWYCKEELVEELRGDLQEQFEEDIQVYGYKRAKRNFIINTFRFMHPSIFHRPSKINKYRTMLLFNYLKIARRNLVKEKLFSIINISGLTAGLASTFLILFYVLGELSYDRFHVNAEDIYRVNVISYNPGGDFYRDRAPAPLADVFRSDFPEIVSATLINYPRTANNLVRANGKEFYESGVIMSDAEFFKVFSFDLINGNPAHALSDPGKVVLTESMALKYFGHTNVEGKLMEYETRLNLVISGVIKDPPSTSSLKFNFIISNTTGGLMPDGWLTDWGNSNATTYLRFAENYNPGLLEARLPDIVKRNVTGLDKQERFVMHLQPLTDIHLNPHVPPEQVWSASNKKYIYILPAIVLFILLISSFNYINLSMARMLNRLKEVGLRKVMGGRRRGLIYQFFIETLIIVVISALLAVMMMISIIPVYNSLTNTLINPVDLLSPIFIAIVIGIVLGISILTSIYPAIVVVRINTVSALRQTLSDAGRSKNPFNSVLLIIQFGATLIMIVSSVLVNQQLQFFQTKPLGFDKEQVIYFRETDPSFWNQAEAFRVELLRNPDVGSVSLSSGVPGSVGYGGTVRYGEDGRMEVLHILIDHDFMDLYNFEIVEGRGFDRESSIDETQAYVINETAAKAFGWDNPISQRMTLWGTDGQVIGVVKDFHYQSLENPIGPIVFHFGPKRYNTISIKFATGNTAHALESVKDQWNQLMPDRPFQYQFVDSKFEEYYQEEQNFSIIADIATLLGVLLAMTGLFSLTAFTMNQRAKEIGIRRVLGAKYRNILQLFLNQTIFQCLVAMIFAFPMGYYGISNWLDGFAYHVDISLFSFLIPFVSLLILVILTVGLQVRRFSGINPVESIRNE